MKIIFFTTKKDLSLPRLKEESEKLKKTVSVIYFETLSFVGNTLYTNSHPLKSLIEEDDLICIRWPFDADDTDIEYNVFVHSLLAGFPKQVVLDKKCLKNFSPFYEDKFFQSVVFSKLGIPTPKTYFFSTEENFNTGHVSFPLVLKKRISSRSKNNFLVNSKKEMKEKLKGKNIRDYIFQEVIDIEKDMRVLMLKNNLLGIVRRFTHIREGNRLAVRGREVIPSLPLSVIVQSQKIQNYLGADFVGFDVLQSKDGTYYFIEANLSPQFDKFEDATGVNVAKKVIQMFLDR